MPFGRIQSQTFPKTIINAHLWALKFEAEEVSATCLEAYGI